MITDQDIYWAGRAGDEYNARNVSNEGIAVAFMARVLRHADTDLFQRVIELGANDGRNLKAIKTLLPNVQTCGVEINVDACAKLRDVADEVWNASLLDLDETAGQYDLVFTKGVLIHIAPEHLPRAYDVLNGLSARYIMLAEYYSPRLEMIPYRGHNDRLWKGPHAEQMMAKYPDLKLVDYGFVSKLDPNPQDDLTFWVLSK